MKKAKKPNKVVELLKRVEQKGYCAYTQAVAYSKLRLLKGEIEDDEYAKLKLLLDNIAFDNPDAHSGKLSPYGYEKFAEYAKELIAKYSDAEG